MTLVPRSLFTTDTLPERDRFEAWRSLFSAHDLDADPVGFSGSIETVVVGAMALRVMNAAPQGPARSRSQIRRDGQDGFILHLSRHAYSVETERGIVEVPAGAVSLNDLSQPYRRSRVPETGSLILALPRSSIAAVVPDEEALHGLILHGGAGRLLADHIRSLAMNSPAARRWTRPISPRRRSTWSRPAPARAWRRPPAPARRSMPPGSGPPNASSATISPRRSGSTRWRRRSACRARSSTACSSRGGVARALARQRLAAIRTALEDPLERRSIGEIGEAYGFGNAAFLSRAFRQAYGVSPRGLPGGHPAGPLDPRRPTATDKPPPRALPD